MQDSAAATASSSGNTGNDTVAIVTSNPAPLIETVARSGANIAVTFSTSFDPNQSTRYSLLYSGTVNSGKAVAWTCKAGSAATSELQAMATATSNAISATPLPAEWAPAGCTS